MIPKGNPAVNGKTYKLPKLFFLPLSELFFSLLRQHSLLLHKVITFNNFSIILNLYAPPNFFRCHPDVSKELECFFSENSKVLFIVQPSNSAMI